MMRFCESCGSEVPESASFCGNCGQAARRNGGYGAPGDRIAGPENNLSETNSPKRPARRPYQYSPPLSQQGENRQQAGEPTVRYTPRTSVASPVQQTPPVAPAAGPGAQQYPYARPQGPIYIGGAGPNEARPVKPRRPAYRRKGCLISFVVVLLLLVILLAIAVPTAQKVLAFGSAISTQAPLSSQTGYMGTSDRVNILILGYGGSGHSGAYLTDSMVIMSLIPSSHHTTLISVPRDLWVQNPANSGHYSKLNAVYPTAAGADNTDPVAGGNAAAQKVSLVTGLDVKYWMTINFTGFRDFIDAIGGVDVNVPDAFNACYPKNDDASVDPSWIKVQFNKGLQHMNGERAITYARAREPLEVCGKGTSENLAELTDFGRSARQQIIMKAALAKLKDWHTWPSFFGALDALKKTIYSNLSLADLAQFALKMDLNNAHRVGLSNSNVLMDTTSNDGQAILSPKNGDWKVINDYINQQLYN